MDLTQFVVVAGVVVAVLSFIVWPLFGRARAGTPARGTCAAPPLLRDVSVSPSTREAVSASSWNIS